MDMNTLGKMWMATTMAMLGGLTQEAKAEESKTESKPAEEAKAETTAVAKAPEKDGTVTTKTPNGETTVTRKGNTVTKHHREVNDIKDADGKVIGHQTIEYTTETYNEPEEPKDCKCVCHQQNKKVIYYVRDPFDDFDMMPMMPMMRPRAFFWGW